MKHPKKTICIVDGHGLGSGPSDNPDTERNYGAGFRRQGVPCPQPVRAVQGPCPGRGHLGIEFVKGKIASIRQGDGQSVTLKYEALDRLSPTGEQSKELITDLYNTLRGHGSISIHAGAQVTG
jgi:hypothetical protein